MNVANEPIGEPFTELRFEVSLAELDNINRQYWRTGFRMGLMVGVASSLLATWLIVATTLST